MVGTAVTNKQFYRDRGVEAELRHFQTLYAQKESDTTPQAVLTAGNSWLKFADGSQLFDRYLHEAGAQAIPSNSLVLSSGSHQGELLFFGGKIIVDHGFEHGSSSGYFEIFRGESFPAPNGQRGTRIYEKQDFADFLLGALKIAEKLTVLITPDHRANRYTESMIITSEADLRDQIKIAVPSGLGNRELLFA